MCVERKREGGLRGERRGEAEAGPCVSSGWGGEGCIRISTYILWCLILFPSHPADPPALLKNTKTIHRMQRLTSITEQLRRKDCKTVIGLLTALTKNSADQSKQKLILLLRR